MIDASVFAPGKVIYNCFSISFEKAFDQQLESLTEDLIQVEYEQGFIVDIGWYPEYDPKGSLVVQLIKDENWDKPVEKAIVANMDEMRDAIKRMKSVISIL